MFQIPGKFNAKPFIASPPISKNAYLYVRNSTLKLFRVHITSYYAELSLDTKRTTLLSGPDLTALDSQTSAIHVGVIRCRPRHAPHQTGQLISIMS